MASRYSLRQAPRESELFEGMVRTPARRASRRRSEFAGSEDGHSGAETGSGSTAAAPRSRSLRRRNMRSASSECESKNDGDGDGDGDNEDSTAPTTPDRPPAPQEEPAPGQVRYANMVLKKGQVIDGWAVGTDPKIDTSGLFEFGGSWGSMALMLGFPLLMWYMWIGATYYDGGLPVRAPGQSWRAFAAHLAGLVRTGAFPHARAWAMYWIFFTVEGAFYCLMPGIWGWGKPLPHEGGKQLPYYCSAYVSFYTTIALALGLHATGLFPLYTLVDEFGPLMSVSILSGTLVSVAAYASAVARGATHRMTGYPVYDFFMGAELNPRLFGILDFKMFFEIRLPWFMLLLITMGTAARQWDRYGYVSAEVGFLLMAHFLYASACAKGEQLAISSWDMYYEKWGFMLIFWNMAGVPLSYCHCSIYLANHDPAEYGWSRPVLALLFASYLFVYWVWDTTNSQKNAFRALERGNYRPRNTFPQLPWQVVLNPRVIETRAGGDRILADGWYGLARKIHYSCDAYFALCWGLITGFRSPYPWFYFAFFVPMIAHRAWRDIARCREKYGEAWAEYERQVPYLFIPYLF